MIGKERIAEWRNQRGGYVSALGEYTPDEFWELLDAYEKLAAEPYYSKEMHDNHVKALAAVTTERDDAKAEIARLEKERWDQFKRGDAAIARAEKAEAEKERLREALDVARAYVDQDDNAGHVVEVIDAALKPDTGE